jgi:hypothetical protein
LEHWRLELYELYPISNLSFSTTRIEQEIVDVTFEASWRRATAE